MHIAIKSLSMALIACTCACGVSNPDSLGGTSQELSSAAGDSARKPRGAGRGGSEAPRAGAGGRAGHDDHETRVPVCIVTRPRRGNPTVTAKLVEPDECRDITRQGGAICAAGNADCCLSPANTAICTNLKTDAANCGTCGHACAGGQSCNAGVCEATCDGGTCGGSTDLTLTAQLPTDRSGKVTLSWTLPQGSFASYALRCDPTALAASATADQKQAWWDAARVMALPADLKPPAASVQLDFRVGDNNHCLLRAQDAAGQATPLGQTTNIQVKFREARYAPSASTTATSAGNDFAPVGDVNGDGVSDLLVGGGGEAYLVFGSSNLPNANATRVQPSLTFVGRGDSTFGADVAAIGDWNGDGRNDFAIGDSLYGGGQGRVLIYFGRASGGWGASTRITVADSCVADVCIVGSAGSRLGFAIAGAGNFDNTGTVELAVGAPGYNNFVGRLYVLRYNAYATGNAPAAGAFYGVNLAADTQTDGYVLDGVAGSAANASRVLGMSVAGIGAYDAQPGTELVVGAPGSSADAVNGRLLLVSGFAAASGGLVALPATQVRQLDEGKPEVFASSVFALGNVFDVVSANKPGTLDIGVFNFLDTGFFVYPGDTDFAPASRFLVDGRAQDFGQTVASGAAAGDLDGDGKAELLAAGSSDPLTSSTGGVPYLLYADVLARKLPVDVIATTQASPLVVQASAPSTRRPVEFVGDLNADGKPDLAVGSPEANGGAGEFTILY